MTINEGYGPLSPEEELYLSVLATGQGQIVVDGLVMNINFTRPQGDPQPVPGLEEKPTRGKRTRPRRPVPDIPPLDLTAASDPESDRVVRVTLRIPFYGKRAAAAKFLAETLPRIIAIGIGTNVTIDSADIDGEPFTEEIAAYRLEAVTEPGETAVGGA